MKKRSINHRNLLILCFLLPAAMAIAPGRAGAPPPTCSYVLSPDNATFDAAADNGSFQLSFGDCYWNARTDDEWLSIYAPDQGTSGGFTIRYAVAENTGPARDGVIRIVAYGEDNRTHTVHQAGVNETTTTTTVPQCTTMEDCNDDLFCTPMANCYNGICVPMHETVCSGGYCDEKRDKCVYSWSPGDPCCVTEQVFGEESSEVTLLRRYRDEVLSRNPLGGRCIRVYYYLSPLATRMLEGSPLLQSVTQYALRAVLPYVRWHLDKVGTP